jgi:hypothetical protein
MPATDIVRIAARKAILFKVFPPIFFLPTWGGEGLPNKGKDRLFLSLGGILL